MAREDKNVDEGGSATSSKPTEYTANKAAETNILKPEKKPQESSSKTKNTEERNNSDPKAPKMDTRSSSQLKSVPGKLKNYFAEQDEEYFSSQETDDFLFQENPERNNGIRKKGEFVRSIVCLSITMFLSGIANHFCFSITLYQVIRF